MTMLKATCAIVDQFVESGSFLRTEISACDFGILDSGPTSAITVRPSVSSFTRIGYGGLSEDVWGFSVRGWVQDTGNVPKMLADVIHMHDAIKTTIAGGSMVNCASLSTWVVSMSHSQDNFWNFGGHDYLIVEATVQSREDP